MNIVFFGSSHFAVSPLRALAGAGHKISCVVTQPDRKKGRGLHLSPTIIKAVAQELGLKVYQPEKINTPEAEKFLKALNADLFVVIAYGQILSPKVLEIPKIFSINAHASLLPGYRGAAPISRAIINGDEVTGITIIKLNEKMDAGPVILQSRVTIDNDDTFISLENKLSREAAMVLLKSITYIESGNYKLTPQDKNAVSFAPKLKKSDGLINWDKPAADICNLVRGCYSWPNAFTYYHGKLLKILKARVSVHTGESESPVLRVPGEVASISKDGIIITTGKGNLMVEELQIEGKRPMKTVEFISGHKITPGQILGNPPSADFAE
jgi:methionyl-tRNA formyltransferase